MRFEFDPAKSHINLEKHGIDFVSAQQLWQNPYIVRPTEYLKELRWAAIGTIEGKHWVVVYTLREEVVRLISVRRARSREIEAYEKELSKA